MSGFLSQVLVATCNTFASDSSLLRSVTVDVSGGVGALSEV